MTRKIDKRACRKLAMPELEFNLNEGVLHVESCPYIIRTAVRNIAGQRILVLYIYQRESILAGSIKPRWVMFHSRDDFATLSFREDAKATWQCSTLGSLDRIGGFDSKCAFYRQQDESRVARFCKCERGAISMLGYLQRLISYRKELERKWKKQRAIIDRMKYVPVLPRDLKGFIHREVMPQYLIKMKLYRLVSGIIYGGYSYSALQAINFNGENMRAIFAEVPPLQTNPRSSHS